MGGNQVTQNSFVRFMVRDIADWLATGRLKLGSSRAYTYLYPTTLPASLFSKTPERESHGCFHARAYTPCE